MSTLASLIPGVSGDQTPSGLGQDPWLSDKAKVAILVGALIVTATGLYAFKDKIKSLVSRFRLKKLTPKKDEHTSLERAGLDLK